MTGEDAHCTKCGKYLLMPIHVPEDTDGKCTHNWEWGKSKMTDNMLRASYGLQIKNKSSMKNKFKNSKFVKLFWRLYWKRKCL